ncbi:hypothetical protein ACRRTK_008417 [Alexandromys fortis]
MPRKQPTTGGAVGVCASLSLASVEQWRNGWMNREHAPVPQQPLTANGALCGSLAQV